MIETMKICPRCKEPGEFSPNRSRANGWQSYCIPCMREVNNAAYKKRGPGHRRLKKYGLTAEEFARFGDKCQACGAPAQHIDHCHVTGRVRGVLCAGCNIAAGQVGDDPKRLRAIADYLEG